MKKHKGRTILTLGYEIPNDDQNITQVRSYFGERMSLSDYDIVVIKPIVYQLPDIYIAVRYWKNELSEFVRNGGVLFVQLCEQENCRFGIYDVSNYDIIPHEGMTVINTKGNVLVPKSGLVSKLYSAFKDVMEYRVCIRGNVTPLGMEIKFLEPFSRKGRGTLSISHILNLAIVMVMTLKKMKNMQI